MCVERGGGGNHASIFKYASKGDKPEMPRELFPDSQNFYAFGMKFWNFHESLRHRNLNSGISWEISEDA